jgi:hypothetical protein
MMLRQTLEVGCQALVLPDQLCIAHAEQAFDAADNLADLGSAGELRSLTRRLVDFARYMR